MTTKSNRVPPGLLTLPTGATNFGWHDIAPLPRCPRSYQLARVMGVRPFRRFVPDYMSVGLIVHAGRAQLLHDGYKGELWREATTRFPTTFQKAEGEPLDPSALPVALKCMEVYVAHWRVRPHPTPLAVEHELAPRGLVPDAPTWAHRSARLDSIEEWGGRIYIGEMKTTSKGGASVAAEYALHGQILLQAALWGPEENRKFGPLAGILLDVITKPSGKRGPQVSERKPIPITDLSHALTWFRRDFHAWVMQASTVKWDDRVEHRISSCGRCEFRMLCQRGKAASGLYTFLDVDGARKPLVAFKPSEGRRTPPWE